MTFRDRQPFEETGLYAYQVGPSPADLAGHRAVRDYVADRLQTAEGGLGNATTPADRFRSVRDATKVQSELVTDVADLASLATSLPASLADGEEPAYAIHRRRILLTIAVVDEWLETAIELDRDALAADVAAALEELHDESAALQSLLCELVELVEHVVVALGRCHVCFASREGDRFRCHACGTERHDLTPWHGPDGEVAFDALFTAINGTLQETVTATDRVAERATTFAETVLESRRQ